MKNYISATFFLTLMVVGVLIGLCFFPSVSLSDKPLRRVDLLADIRPDVPEEVCDSDTLVLSSPVKPVFVDTCKTGMTCIEDYSDSTMRGMKHFYETLLQIQTMDRPVRIAYFGDSFIEADIFTADLREMFQHQFGGCGVGYIPVTSTITGYRPTVRHNFGGWKSHSSNDSVGFDKLQQGISGHYFLPYEGAYVHLKGQNKYASRLDTCEISTFYFFNKGDVTVRSRVNGAAQGELYEKTGTGVIQAVSVEGRIGQVRWNVERADSAVFYGVAMDGKRGISLDNFSVRGSSGLHLRNIPLHTLCGFHHLRPYDLIVIQYGLNVATQRGTNYDGYKKGMLTVIEHLKKAFPESSILLVSVGDREYKNEYGELRTMPGVKNLIRYQQSIAADSHIAFWNMYEAMGGQGSIVGMVNQKMANLDYTHINFKGGKHLAGILFETLMYGKEQYEKRKAYEE
ncbi:MAG: SGNH/GDSL hydrolase family protein [Phocaeicola sp.]|nr:SGNH/GDSL hydrolase family protein [Phocaeicola sp.]